MPTIDETIAFIQKAHSGQFDKGGEVYWRHPRSVMQRLGDNATEEERQVALLHDVIEDTPYSAADLLALGYSPAVVTAVELLRLHRMGLGPGRDRSPARRSSLDDPPGDRATGWSHL
jgi:(p)ppGpp synthase/HD superfamily hydrolase